MPILDDALTEPGETFSVSLSSPSNAGLISPATASITINESDSVRFTASAMTVSESSCCSVITVRLDPPAIQTVTVNYASANGSALAGVDYIAKSGTLTFAPGESSKSIQLMVYSDDVGEDTETFTISLSSATNATLGSPASASVTIVDNDP